MGGRSLLYTAVWLATMSAGYLAHPEYSTPGGILNTNCLKGCTEIAVHESNCYPPCNHDNYERCVLFPRHAESNCGNGNVTIRSFQANRPYTCRCYPCLFRSQSGVCVPACTADEEEI